jgi:hypothetical protein
MKKMVLCLAVIILSVYVFIIEAQAQEVRKQEIKTKMESLSIHLQPSARQKVMQAARQLEPQIFSSSGKVDVYGMSVSGIRNQFGNLSSQDIDALVAMVMFEMMKSEEEALKEIADEMNKMNQQKKQQREHIENMKKQRASMKEAMKERAAAPQAAQTRVPPAKIARVPATTNRLNIKYFKAPVLPAFKDTRRMSASELDNEIQKAQDALDSMGDMTELDQLRLHEITQAREQLIQTISNILKQQHDATENIISNIK